MNLASSNDDNHTQAKIAAHNNTWSFVPATRIDSIAKAFASGAGTVIADLEDAVDQANKIKGEMVDAPVIFALPSVIDSVADRWIMLYHKPHLSITYQSTL